MAADETTDAIEEPRGIGRRTLIKQAAVVGAVAWTAPVILDSLSSPAAAFSCGSCFKFGVRGVKSSDSNPTKTGSYPVLKYTVGSCLPNGDGSCATKEEGTSLSDLGVAITAGQFSVDLSNNVTFTISATGTGTGCREKPDLLGASFIWRSTSGDGRAANLDNGVCESAVPGDSATTGGSFPNNHLVAINAVGAAPSVTWQMPSSLKPGSSGGVNFVVGCYCN